MIGPGAGARVMVATRPVDFRKGPDALAALVGKEYGGDPFSGVIYVFGVTSRFVRQTTICRTLWEHRRQAATRRYWYRVSRLIPRSRAIVALRSPATMRRSSSATLSSERDRFRPR